MSSGGFVIVRDSRAADNQRKQTGKGIITLLFLIELHYALEGRGQAMVYAMRKPAAVGKKVNGSKRSMADGPVIDQFTRLVL